MTRQAIIRGTLIYDLPALPRAVFELARARLVLRRLRANTIEALNEDASHQPGPSSAGRDAIVRQVSRIVPAVARRVPWRSDCLVQAIAGQAILAKAGIGTRIVLGVDRVSSGIESHAWLEVDGKVAIGGPVEKYTVVIGSPSLAPLRAGIDAGE